MFCKLTEIIICTTQVKQNSHHAHTDKSYHKTCSVVCLQ